MISASVVQSRFAAVRTPLLAVGLCEGETAPDGVLAEIDAALGGMVARLMTAEEISGKQNEVVILHTPAGCALMAERIAIVGLGNRERLGLEQVRQASASVARKARDLHVASYATLPFGAEQQRISLYESCRATVEAALLGLYRYEEFKEATRSTFEMDALQVVAAGDQVSECERAVTHAVAVARAMYLTRDLSVGPSNLVTPTYLADQARALAQRLNLEITVWGKDEMRTHGMNAALAVNQGSAQPPVFVALRYSPAGASRTLAVVGKGITFDSGGISIKPATHMEYMRHDMTGAATVLGFLQLAVETSLPINLLGVFAATENMPSGTAYKPGDVLRALNGKTIEVVDTDAEGRVTLADTLAYAAEQKPDAIIDLATLTGGCVVALGHHATGLFTNRQELADRLLALGEVSGDRCWQMPMWDVYREQNKTVMADVRNTGGRAASSITAAQFLEEFVADVPWVHLDIAGTAYTEPAQAVIPPYDPRYGATGVGVRLLWHFCQSWNTAQASGA